MARRIADVHGVALSSLTGTGPRGRIVRADVLAAAGLPATGAVESAEPAHTAAGPRRRPPARADHAPAADRPTGGSGAVAAPRHRAGAQPPAAGDRPPDGRGQGDDPAFPGPDRGRDGRRGRLRAQLKELAGARTRRRLAQRPIVKACCARLRRHPRVNGSYVDGAFELHERVNVGVAVAADDALVVPVFHDADIKTLGQIAATRRRLAERSAPGDHTAGLSGATFTVSNLGMYGMTAITPVINPPQAAILGVGAIRDVLARAATASSSTARC